MKTSPEFFEKITPLVAPKHIGMSKTKIEEGRRWLNDPEYRAQVEAAEAEAAARRGRALGNAALVAGVVALVATNMVAKGLDCNDNKKETL